MKVAVIGAGASGVSSAKHIKENGFECDVFEMAEGLGGTWIYTDDVGEDKYGFPVYSAMYKNLRTNLPKEVMGFPDFPVASDKKSYLTQNEVLELLNQYVDHFQLRNLIKFNCMVTDVRPVKENKWQLTYIHKPSKEYHTLIYDAIMVCNGHYNQPFWPKFEGQEHFSGTIDHSHTFRSAQKFEGKNVIIVGAGPSGLDLTLQVSKYAEKVYFSHHSSQAAKTIFPINVEHKPDIKRIIDGGTVEFVDDSCCCVDAIILCTGYKYNFPFLHESCGITVDDNFIQPLYKHMINLEMPTMCFIGIPFTVCTFHMFDLQARYFCKYLNGSLSLPSTEEMREDTNKDMQRRWANGIQKKQAHGMGEYQQEYYDDLASAADTKPINPVLVKLRDYSVQQLYENLIHFRENKYKIIDRETFVRVN
uniref:Flavin-containing monooxygenase n=1 Tax=Diabrotica virgifera virgifera TaxID=50390 RepID=A0A6P7FIB3_DIAVI